MANVVVPQTRREEGFELPEEAVRVSAVPVLPSPSWLLALLWAVLAALLFGFLFFGSIRIGAGNWAGRRMRITQIWPRFLDFLGDQGASAAVVSVVVLALAVALIGGVCLVWLALRLQNQNGDSLAEPSSDS